MKYINKPGFILDYNGDGFDNINTFGSWNTDQQSWNKILQYNVVLIGFLV